MSLLASCCKYKWVKPLYICICKRCSHLYKTFLFLKAKEEVTKRNQERVFDSWHAVHDLARPLVSRRGSVGIWPQHCKTCYWANCTEIISHVYPFLQDGQIQLCSSVTYVTIPTSNNRETLTQTVKPPSHVNQQSSTPNRVTVIKSGHVSISPKWWSDQSI